MIKNHSLNQLNKNLITTKLKLKNVPNVKLKNPKTISILTHLVLTHLTRMDIVLDDLNVLNVPKKY